MTFTLPATTKNVVSMQYSLDIARNRRVLLALREHNNDEDGNLLQLLEHHGETDGEVLQWLDRKSGRVSKRAD